MKLRAFAFSFLALIGLLFTSTFALSQSPEAIAPHPPIPIEGPLPAYFAYGQLQGMSTEDAMALSAGGMTIPMSSYTVTASRDGNTYSGSLVGRSPFNHGSRTTNIPTFIVPVKITMQDSGHVFDPTATDALCIPGKVPATVAENSPVFQNAAFTMNGVSMGTTQYIDADHRAEFWQNLSASGKYHVLMSPITILAEQSLSVPSANGGTFSFTRGCDHVGIMDIGFWDSFVQNTLIPFVANNGGGTASFPFFLLYNVVFASPFVPGTPNNCCILGYHNAFTTGGVVQTYGNGDFDSIGKFTGIADISPTSHEVGEWQDDPLGTNPTPLWGHIGQVSGCQGNLENGDPLSGTLFPSVSLNSFTYHPQELAFFSWFYGAPSLGTSTTKFSNNGTFTSDAGAICH